MFYDNKDIYIAKLHHALEVKITLKREGGGGVFTHIPGFLKVLSFHRIIMCRDNF